MVAEQLGATTEQASVPGCGVASGQTTTTRNEQVTPHSERCPIMVRDAEGPVLAQMRPDIVVWMSLWEKSDIIANGRTLVSGTRAGDAEMMRRMDRALARVTKYGAKVAMVTSAAAAPNDAQGTSNTSNAVDDASYARLDRLLRRFAKRHPETVTLIDFTRRVCPHGAPCPEEVNGIRLRPDGRHFTPTTGAMQARWLLPRVLATRNG